MSGRRVLLTGATGFIGSHCLTSLAQRGFEIHATSTKPVALPGANWHRADLLELSQVSSLLHQIRPSFLMHLAWDVTPGKYWTSPTNLTWVRASLDLLQTFADTGGERVVMAGTCAEYDWSCKEVFNEAQTPLKPASLYGTCKLALATMLGAFGKQQGFSTAWARLFYLYGPGEHPERLIPSVIRGLLNHSVPSVRGSEIRDYLYVKDAADALVALLDSPVQGAVNVASGIPVTVNSIVDSIARQLAGESLVRSDAVRDTTCESSEIVADVTRLSREVQWSPQVSFDDGLARTISWWQEELRPK
jgi:nucleoside-diphosphate-sugar epimerase